MKVKADYEMTFSLDEIVTMADDNVSYGGGRFARKWLDEIENNSTDFVQFVTQAIDEYDKSVNTDKQIAITDDDINAMGNWKESEWIFDGVLENYPKMATNVKKDGTVFPIYSTHEVFDKGEFVAVKMTVSIDTDMLKYKLENERTNRMVTAEQDGKNTGYWKVTMEYYDDSPFNTKHDKMARYNVYVTGYDKKEAYENARETVTMFERGDEVVCAEPISEKEWEIGCKAFGDGVRNTDNLMQTFDKKSVSVEQNKVGQKGKEQ